MSPLPPRVRVFFDGEPINIWSWARVRHALNWYSQDAYRAVMQGDKLVCDEAEHPVDLDGALEDGARFLLRDVSSGRSPQA
jgi:hypothetical protein